MGWSSHGDLAGYCSSRVCLFGEGTVHVSHGRQVVSTTDEDHFTLIPQSVPGWHTIYYVAKGANHFLYSKIVTTSDAFSMRDGALV